MTLNAGLLQVIAVCMGEDIVSYGAMVQAFVKWAENHPKRWGMLRELGVRAASAKRDLPTSSVAREAHREALSFHEAGTPDEHCDRRTDAVRASPKH